MNPLSLDQISSIVDGEFIGGVDGSMLVTGVSIDSRKIQQGCLFIAIKGDNHDGHDHLPAAGAVAAIVQTIDGKSPAGLARIKVSDTRIAMGKLATFVRRQMKSSVIAVAGSNGKTSTKHLIHAALSGSLNGSTSPKSFNNDIGVPLTIFPASPAQDYLILEVGTNHPGEILHLTKMALPDVAIITNIGAEHLEFLGDLDGVRRENAAIIAGLNPGGLLIINGDDELLPAAVAAYPGKKITFGFGPRNDLRATNITHEADGVRFDLADVDQSIFVPMLGRHTAANALAAIAVARHLGVTDAASIAGLSTATGPEWRLQLQTFGTLRILNDAYNANPHSMRAALETLRDMHTTGRRVAILGDMRELGETADHYHRDIGQFTGSRKIDRLICVGEKSKLIAESASTAGISLSQITCFATAADCVANIKAILQPHDLVLLKASRTVGLEKIADYLRQSSTDVL